MSMHRRSQGSVAAWMGVVFAVLSTVWVAEAWSQASYTAQIRGVVKDQSGALAANATVSITNDATGISETARSDDHGLYILTGLRPAVYTITADAAGVRPAAEKDAGLQAAQQTTIDFPQHPFGSMRTA